MHCCIRTPDRTLYDGPSTMIVARSEDGEFAVLDGHAPMLVALRAGAVRVRTEGGDRIFACAPGVLRVGAQSVTILAPTGLPADEIDLPSVRRRLDQLVADADGPSGDPRLRREIAELETLRTVGEAYRG